ncbi:sodium ABC transporter ATP-binding protein [Virgibacillus profundi]|uniref:Sodium ABC transporter ATP-binding protein n=1 Tax=Virgibacillus profundi TaxID=2024555 RepID=A0A2A2IGR6_9BACI|nr:ABC transporter ATP-binding protein [Virgibacillus profundi]PAV30949.1 sodium ABC transporter ATP-binding protein [Virgibacillus profundi]PXY55134.1 ABC transporter ATP-binding protein [Virgibacillus profundi]
MNTVEFHNVTKKRKGFSVEDLNITIPKGYITGFIGPNGSGKTTTIQLMMNILQVDEGDIQLFGRSHKDHHVKQKIGFVYDDLYMYEEFTIKKMKSFIAPFYETWNEELFQENLAKFELPLRKKIKHFSKGMKMKCSLLFALSHEPEFIVMDEPTSGLDPIFRRELLDHLQELMVNENQTIFLSTHITTNLDRMADYVVFIFQGKVIFQKSMEELQSQFHIIKGKSDIIDADTKELFSGLQKTKIGFSGLFEGDPSIFDPYGEEIIIEKAALEDIMYFMTRKEN